MIRIICPSNNIPERRYAIEVIFNDLLGCNLTADDIQFDAQAVNYTIQVGGKEIVVEDHFFQQYPEPLSYLKAEHLPAELVYFHARDKEIPIIYGVDKFEETENKIVIGLDIFASTFFMLTRWEESLYGRDEKGDCPEKLLFTIRENIYQRPLAHEYEYLLKTLLNNWGISTKERAYSVVMSHDVDGLVPPSFKKIAIDACRQIKNGPPKNPVVNLTWQQKILYKCTFPKAYSQVKLYVKLCERYGIPEWFYFKVCAKGEREATYYYNDKRLKRVIDVLAAKNNPNIYIGFHPSQTAFDNQNQLEAEWRRIVNVSNSHPSLGRGHHLLYNLPTLRMWEKMMSRDGQPFQVSNCVFHAHQGFRSGIAVPYPIFDYYERKKMNLYEHPCQMMDTVLRYDLKKKSEEERWREIRDIIDVVRYYKGELVLTWHIYIRNVSLIKKYFQWGVKTVDYAARLK